MVPPLPWRYSEELQAVVAGMLAQAPAARPTVDDILQSPAVRLRGRWLLPEAGSGRLQLRSCPRRPRSQRRPCCCPAVQAQRHMALLPEELRQRCISPALSSEQAVARLLQPIKASWPACRAGRREAAPLLAPALC